MADQVLVFDGDRVLEGTITERMSVKQFRAEALSWLVGISEPTEVLEALEKTHGVDIIREWLEGGDRRPPIFGQRDPRWAMLRYTSKTSHIFYSFGCYVVALTSLAAWAGYKVDPPTLASYLDGTGAFVGGDLMAPQKIAGLCPDLQSFKRYDWQTKPADIAALGRLLLRSPQIVQIDFAPAWGLQAHFVLAYQYVPPSEGRDSQRDQLWVMDPWDGAYVDVCADVVVGGGKRVGGGYFWPQWTGEGAFGRGEMTRAERVVHGARTFVVGG